MRELFREDSLTVSRRRPDPSRETRATARHTVRHPRLVALPDGFKPARSSSATPSRLRPRRSRRDGRRGRTGDRPRGHPGRLGARQLRPRHREHRGVGRGPARGVRRSVQGASRGCFGAPGLPRASIGTWLADWLETLARARGSKLFGQTVPGDSNAEAFFESRGYRVGWTSWVLPLPEGATIEPQPLPEGYTLREFAGAVDGRVAFQLIEDAFNEWPDRDPSTYEDWAPQVPAARVRAVADPVRGRPAGHGRRCLLHDPRGCHGVRRLDRRAARPARSGSGPGPPRRRFLARSGARRHGEQLSTDSRTGALGLDEHVGMQVTQTWRQWMTDL